MAVSWCQESRAGRSCPQAGSSSREDAFIPTGLNLNSWPPVPSQVPGHGTTRAPLAINEEPCLHPPHTWPPPCRRSVLPPPEKQSPLRCHLLLSRTRIPGQPGARLPTGSQGTAASHTTRGSASPAPARIPRCSPCPSHPSHGDFLSTVPAGVPGPLA